MVLFHSFIAREEQSKDLRNLELIFRPLFENSIKYGFDAGFFRHICQILKMIYFATNLQNELFTCVYWVIV